VQRNMASLRGGVNNPAANFAIINLT